MLAEFRGKLRLLIIGLLLLGAGISFYYYYQKELKVIPEELMNRALDNTLQAETYRFRLTVKLQTGGRELELSNVQGERSRTGDFHFQGRMTGQSVDVYHIREKTYFKDPIAGRWMIHQGSDPLKQELFMVEIDPLSILRFAQIEELQYLGRQKDIKGRPYLLVCRPKVVNQFLNRYARDFSYKLWIDRGSTRIQRVTVEATSRQKPTDKLTLDLELLDFNRRLNIKAPV
ncbi:MAG: hypothetical protein PWP65_1374 [Clostridia bacterium]|nr:hypothetical protein [Clostridia bacterium]